MSTGGAAKPHRPASNILPPGGDVRDGLGVLKPGVPDRLIGLRHSLNLIHRGDEVSEPAGEVG